MWKYWVASSIKRSFQWVHIKFESFTPLQIYAQIFDLVTPFNFLTGETGFVYSESVVALARRFHNTLTTINRRRYALTVRQVTFTVHTSVYRAHSVHSCRLQYVVTILISSSGTVNSCDPVEAWSLVFSERELKFMFAICHRRSVCLSVVCL